MDVDLTSVSGQYISVRKDEPDGFLKVQEGCAVVLIPSNNDSAKSVEATTSVFYNKAQVVNRDLSVCVLETFANCRKREPRKKGGTEDGICVLEALSATGLRSIRYWHEVSGIRRIIANDLDIEAAHCIDRNLKHCCVPVVEQTQCHDPAKPGVVVNCGDAIVLMQHLALDPKSPYRLAQVVNSEADGSKPFNKEVLQMEKMDVVDLDPYGTAVPFLAGAVSCAKEGALLMVTCTDSAILCGNYSETCFAKYGSLSIRASSTCHELAARIVLACIERETAKHGKYIEPLLSLHIDFYVRVFVRIWNQPAEAKLACAKLAHLFHCVNCPRFHFLPCGNVRRSRKARDLERKEKEKRAREEGDERNASEAKEPELLGKTVYPTPLSRNESFHVTPPVLDIAQECDVCGGKISISGPLYAGPMHNQQFVSQVLETLKSKGSQKLQAFDRVQGLLVVALEELADTPLFYEAPAVASLLKCPVPPMTIIVGAIRRLGYRCSQVHCEPNGIKTDAPLAVLVGILRHNAEIQQRSKALAEKNDDSEKTTSAKHLRIPPTPASWQCPTNIKVAALTTADLSYSKEYDWRSNATGVVKFVPNAPNWGPKGRQQIKSE